MNSKILGGLLGIGAVAAGIYFLVRKPAPKWKVGDVIFCDIPGDPGYFEVLDTRWGTNGWEYLLGEGCGRWILSRTWATEKEILSYPCSRSVCPW